MLRTSSSGLAYFLRLPARAVRAPGLSVMLALSACLPTGVETLAPNMARLNFQGLTAPSDQDAIREAMERGAKETISRGYDLFRFVDWKAGAPRTVALGEHTTANFSVTVVMFRDGEQGANPVFNAREILRALAPSQ